MAEATLVDRRVRRTRRLLQEAVLAMAEERDLGAITVQDITRHAGVNRATFYQHYRDRDALLDETFDALLAELTAECGPLLDGIARLTPEEVPPSVVAMLREVRRRGGLYRRLLDPGGRPPSSPASKIITSVCSSKSGATSVPAMTTAKHRRTCGRGSLRPQLRV